MTVRDSLVSSLRDASLKHGPEEIAPAAVLWTDKDALWNKVLPALRTELPGLLTLGAYDLNIMTGPAIWVRCQLAGELDSRPAPPAVIYLPGVSRQILREVEDCPKELQPLVELQFRGTLWSHANGKDWTPFAFLLDLGLDVAGDDATKSAIQERLAKLLDSEVEELRSLGRLDAHKIRNLGSDWPSDILAWMQNPLERNKEWATFRAACTSSYGFDPEADGELVAAEKLAEASGPWNAVWRRFSHSGRRYPNVVSLLRQITAPEMFFRIEGYPTKNTEEENLLREELSKIAKKDPASIRKRVLELDQEHKQRRNWVWCELGESKMAVALEHLALCAKETKVPLTSSSLQELMTKYANSGHQADLSAWQAYACVDATNDIKIVENILRGIYLPWMEEAAIVFANFCEESPLLGFWTPTPMPEVGECILFADGLRYDVATLLFADLKSHCSSVTLDYKVCALPSVTPTAKPAVSPISGMLSGNGSGSDFRPVVTASGTGLQPANFKQLLGDHGVVAFGVSELGDPSGRGWTEAGALDSLGHAEGARLARRIQEETRVLSERVRSLLEAGWKKVRVVTDHGWLWMPGGLPKAVLPTHLAESRWGRCASLNASASTTLQVVPWHWQQTIAIAVPPGVSCFKLGYEYAHGGLSLQECVVPVLEIISQTVVSNAKILDARWVGLKCAVTVSDGSGLSVDIRTKPADPHSSVLHDKVAKSIGSDSASLFANDDFEGHAAFVVLIDGEGRVVAKRHTTVGGLQ